MTAGIPENRKLAAADGWVLLIILAVCVAIRVATLGDANYHDDDLFYALVGQRMHDGALPYVDVWDRKPFGLFAIYYLIAALSRSLWTYQLVGWAFLTTTGWVIHRIVLQWTGRQGALLAGLAYVVITFPFGGENGQAPVFYNLFIAAAVWLVTSDFSRLDRGRCSLKIWAAMALCGLAIWVKQTAVFEAIFLGCFVLLTLYRAGLGQGRILSLAAGFALVGAAPMLITAGAYWWIGHWGEFWNAMWRANLQRSAVGMSKGLFWNLAAPVRALVIFPVAVLALLRWTPDRRLRQFLTCWLITALVGFLSVANFFVHYALPVLVPLCVIAGLAFARGSMGRILFVALLCYDLLWHTPFDFAATARSNQTMTELTRLVRQHSGNQGLLVYDGPPYLYALTGKRLISPLTFPHHLNHASERDLSHLSTSAEMDRILAQKPGAIVTSLYPRNFPVNRDSYDKMRAYAKAHCKVVGIIKTGQEPPSELVVFGDCGEVRR